MGFNFLSTVVSSPAQYLFILFFFFLEAFEVLFVFCEGRKEHVKSEGSYSNVLENRKYTVNFCFSKWLSFHRWRFSWWLVWEQKWEWQVPLRKEESKILQLIKFYNFIVLYTSGGPLEIIISTSVVHISSGKWRRWGFGWMMRLD